MTSASLAANRWRVTIGIALLGALLCLAYLPALRGGFVWDDDVYVTDNPLLTAPDGLRRIWFSTDAPSQYFPLVYTVFRAERALWGLEPLGYHLVNLLIHGANALLLWRVLASLKIPGAPFAAALFALHPVQVESVAWITELKNVLSAFFSLLATLAWLGHLRRDPVRGQAAYGAALFLYALALFAKTTAVTLPLLLAIVSWQHEGRLDRRRLRGLLPFLALGLALSFVTLWWESHHQGTVGETFALSPAQRLLIAGRALWFYLSTLVWPARLSFSYPRWQVDPGAPAAYLYPAVAAAGLVALWYWHWRGRIGRGPLAAAAFFVVALSPLLGFFSLYTFRYAFVADHYQYVAAIGPFALVAAAVSRRGARAGFPRLIRLTAAALVLALLAALSYRQAGAYRSEETLWRDVLVKYPEASIASVNLGKLLLDQGREEEAIVVYTAAVRFAPELLEARVNLGALLAARGDLEGSLGHLRAATRGNQEDPELLNNLGMVLMMMERFEEAEAAFARALRARPGYRKAEMGRELAREALATPAFPGGHERR